MGQPTTLEDPTAVCQLRLQRLALTRASSRFYALLHQQQFDEVANFYRFVLTWQAMAFAQQFGQDAGLVHRIHATRLLDRAVHSPSPSILEVSRSQTKQK